MRIFLAYLLINSFFLGFSQNDTIIDNVSYNVIKTYKKGAFKITGNKDSKSNRVGHWIKYTRNGDVKYQGNYFNNKRHGIWEITDKFGRCCWEGTYTDGFKEGKWTRGKRVTVVFKKGIKVRFIISKKK